MSHLHDTECLHTCSACASQTCAENFRRFQSTVTLNRDVLSVGMAEPVEFSQSDTAGVKDDVFFCDSECFGEWLGPRLHRLFTEAAS